MAKRLRLTENEAARAGLKSYETLEGKRWLWKALNPNDSAQAAIGVPAKDFHNISVLNYQSNYDINAPSTVSAAKPSFDIDMYLMQNPLLFGVSIAYPSGTMDLSQVQNFQMSYLGTNETTTGYITLVPSVAPNKSVAYRVTQQLINSQINPAVFNASNSLSSRRVLFSQLAQKSRICYGGATIIPTCSDLNNGGSISVCQQICQPRQTIVSNNSSITLNTFTASDFPDVEDTIQNPQMYYARFFDGAYIPYKLREPDSPEYISTERQVTTRSPYCVTGVSAIGVTSVSIDDFTVSEIPMVLTPSPTSTTFTLRNSAPFYCPAENKPAVFALRFYVTLFTGQRMYIDFSLEDDDIYSSTSFFTTDAQTTPIETVALTSYINEGTHDSPTITDISLSSLLCASFHLPDAVTAYQTSGSDNLDNPVGSHFFSMDITNGVNVAKELTYPTIPDNVGLTMSAVHMTGVSSTAPVKMIVRFGIEILLTAGSPYSPFKFLSPKYDESALKSYIRCARVMRDAFFANAGADPGQGDFMQRLGALVEFDTPDDLLRIMNQGGRWQGTI